MSIGVGVVYLLATFVLPILIKRFAPPAITSIPIIGYALFTFPKWYGLLIASICCMLYLGAPTSEEDFINAPTIIRRYGRFFDLLGGVLLLVSISLLIKSVFLK